MKSGKKTRAELYETDVVVIGSGGGLAAAVAAAEKGAKVIVLEKRKVFGGNTALARALMAAESPIQRRLRIDARKEDIFKTRTRQACFLLQFCHVAKRQKVAFVQNCYLVT